MGTLWQKLRQHQVIVTLGILIVLGTVIRFYNLQWDEGYFLHPDERNIGYAMSNLDVFKGQLNPKFWAYGSLPIYLIYFLTVGLNFILSADTTAFDWYLMTGRYISALCSVALIPLTFYLTTKLGSGYRYQIAGLVAAFWVTFMPGMIQFAHFTTFETFLTLQYIVLLWACYVLIQKGDMRSYLLVGLIFGLSVGTKITSLALAPIPLLAHLIYIYNIKRTFNPLAYISIKAIALLGAVVLSAFLASPFHILDWEGFQGSLTYERGVADGSMLVFYTEQFLGTVPVLYQLTRIFPYILSIPLTLLSLVAIAWWGYAATKNVWTSIRKKDAISLQTALIVLIVLSVLLYFAFNAMLFVKWTRYMIPLLPMLAILVSALLYHEFLANQKTALIHALMVAFISAWIAGQGLTFTQVYFRPDTRVEAAYWARDNLGTATVASEVYDLGILPFDDVFGSNQVFLVDVYNVEQPHIKQQAQTMLIKSEYFIVLSQRVWDTRLRLPETFPIGNSLYKTLKTEYRWQKVATFEYPDIACNVWTAYCLGGYYPADETFSVFDHPPVKIYKKDP